MSEQLTKKTLALFSIFSYQLFDDLSRRHVDASGVGESSAAHCTAIAFDFRLRSEAIDDQFL